MWKKKIEIQKLCFKMYWQTFYHFCESFSRDKKWRVECKNIKLCWFGWESDFRCIYLFEISTKYGMKYGIDMTKNFMDSEYCWSYDLVELSLLSLLTLEEVIGFWIFWLLRSKMGHCYRNCYRTILSGSVFSWIKNFPVTFANSEVQ